MTELMQAHLNFTPILEFFAAAWAAKAVALQKFFDESEEKARAQLLQQGLSNPAQHQIGELLDRSDIDVKKHT